MRKEKRLWRRKKRAKTGLGAKEDGSSAIGRAGEVGRVGVVETASTQGNEGGGGVLGRGRVHKRMSRGCFVG
jgi:hypothetical protein